MSTFIDVISVYNTLFSQSLSNKLLTLKLTVNTNSRVDFLSLKCHFLSLDCFLPALNPVVIPGVRPGTRCAVLRGSLLIMCKQVRLSFV